MLRLIFISILLIFFVGCNKKDTDSSSSITYSPHGLNFSKSKKLLLKQVYFDHQETFYCDNPYKIERVESKEKTLIIPDNSKYSPRNRYTKSGKINERAKRVEWEHVFPAHHLGQHLKCWQEGGRNGCKSDPTFREMEADMHNLVPSIGEVNGDISNYRYGADLPKVGQYGKCELEIDFKEKRVYPKKDIRGDIARIYFYMSERYSVNLSVKDRKMMEAWNRQDPVSEWEILRDKRIESIQGNKNRFVR